MHKLSRFFLKYKFLFFVPIAGLFLALLPLHSAQAFWWNDLLASITSLTMIIIAGPMIFALLLIVNIAVFVSFAFYALANIILMWVTSTNFLALHLTRDGLVSQGLLVTTGLANLVFVLALIFIAIATILKLDNYGIKKVLPKFIVTIILINFIPVIAGAIIDLTNILTQTFLKGGWGATEGGGGTSTGNDFINIFWDKAGIVSMKDGFTSLISNFGPAKLLILPSYIFDTVISSILTSGVVTIFGFFAGFVILLYAALFVVRIIMIWLLVILAPIAWACRVVPTLEKWYGVWWKYFIQWAFVGALMSFVLWLTKGLLGVVKTQPIFDNAALSTEVPLAGDSFLNSLLAPFTNIITNLLPLVAIIVLMIVGFTMSVKAAGGGTQVIMNWGKNVGKSAGKWVGNRTGKWAANTPFAQKTLEKMAKMENMLPSKISLPGGKKISVGEKGFGKFLGKTMGAPAAAIVRSLGREGIAFSDESADISKAKQKFDPLVKKEKWDAIAAAYKGASSEDKIILASILAEKKGGKGLEKLTEDQRIEALGLTQRHSPENTKALLAAYPELAKEEIFWNKSIDDNSTKDKSDMEEIMKEENINNKTIGYLLNHKEDPDYKKVHEKLAYRRTIRGLNRDQVGKLSSELIISNEDRGKEFRKEFVLNKKAEHWEAVEDQFGTDYVKRLDEARCQIANTKDGAELLARKNPFSLTAPYNGTRRDLYTETIDPRTGKEFENMEKVKEYIKNVNRPGSGSTPPPSTGTTPPPPGWQQGPGGLVIPGSAKSGTRKGPPQKFGNPTRYSQGTGGSQGNKKGPPQKFGVP
jgi:hypothetical protein